MNDISLEVNNEPHPTASLEDALADCSNSAKRGYQMATGDLKSMRRVLEEAKEQIQTCSSELSRSKLDISGVLANLQDQLRQIRDSFDTLSNEIQSDLVDKEERLSVFSITIFGRTMAGKSTLMEILREGDGAAIGKGAQRTTRDVRSYTWNNLEITDVPGIAAFEGEDDEQIAFSAARQADLILFLITDDAPQAAEAQCLAEIREIGKPVLGIMNVKTDIDPSIMKLALRDLNTAFDYDRLNGIKRQFGEFAKNYGQDWRDIYFVYTHLKSAFMSQQPEYQAYSKELWSKSHFEAVEDEIIRQVEERGKFLRIKTFVDAVAKPSVDIFNMLVEQSMKNSEGGRTIIAKRKKLVKWKEDFLESGNRSIDYFCDTIRSRLTNLIPDFVDEHYEDSGAGKAWIELIRQEDIEGKCKTVFKQLADECENEMREIAREIEEEMSFSSLHFSGDKSIRMEILLDGKRITRWGFSLGSGILTIGGLVTGTLTGPVGWIAAGLGFAALIVPNLFPDHEKTVSEAKQKLRERLNEDVNQVVEKMKEQLKRALKSELVEKCIVRAEHNMTAAVRTIFSLSKTQRELADHLNRQLKQTNTGLLQEALKHIGAAGLEYHFDDVARLPGEYLMLEVGQDKMLPKEEMGKLAALLQEKILFVRHQEGDSPRTLVGRILRQAEPSFDWKTISLEEKPQIVHVPLDKLSPYGLKLKGLAQQLTNYLITE